MTRLNNNHYRNKGPTLSNIRFKNIIIFQFATSSNNLVHSRIFQLIVYFANLFFSCESKSKFHIFYYFDNTHDNEEQKDEKEVYFINYNHDCNMIIYLYRHND